jgi:hypothetical protein
VEPWHAGQCEIRKGTAAAAPFCYVSVNQKQVQVKIFAEYSRKIQFAIFCVCGDDVRFVRHWIKAEFVILASIIPVKKVGCVAVFIAFGVNPYMHSV